MNLWDFLKPARLPSFENIDSSILETYSRLARLFLQKITAIQTIVLKTTDFENQHFYELNERKLWRSSRGGLTSTKLYEHYSRILKGALVQINDYIAQEKRLVLLEHGLLKTLEKREIKLPKLEQDAAQFNHLESSLRTCIEQQEEVAIAAEQRLTRFVGSENMWITDYGGAQRSYKTQPLYNKPVNDKKIILNDWYAFTSLITVLSKLMQTEVVLLLDTTLGEGVAAWQSLLLGAIKKKDTKSHFKNIYSEEKLLRAFDGASSIEIFHATERQSSLFPLTEVKFPRGFFAVIGKEVYARKIKFDQLSSQSGLYIRVVRISLPQKVFKTLFLPDNQEGRPGDTLSIEAYDNAYVLPVSRFPYLNALFGAGLVQEV